MRYAHRALDTQAWTELVSNTTSLVAGTAEDDPRPWLGWGRAAADQLSVYLHEATHHWCFVSPVAFAIAGLNLRARVGMMRLANGEPGIADSVAVDLVRAETALALLRPFAEGLALFAEFDAVSRVRSEAMSPVMQSLLQFFVDPRRTAALINQGAPVELAVGIAMGETLHALRTDPATLNRKASLLLQPFSLKAGGYLVGYLAVKNLWRAALRKHFVLANETDSFLMYLRSYLYDDWGLVATLLTPERNAVRGAERVVRHLSKRLDDWETLGPADFSAYESSVARERADPGSLVLHGLRVDDGAEAAGNERLTELMTELIKSRVDDSTAAQMAGWHDGLLGRRHYMNLASARVDLRRADGGLAEVYWADAPVLQASRGDFTGDPRECVGPAHLEVIVSMLRGDRFERAAVVHRDSEVLICSPIGLDAHADDTRDEIVRTFIERARITKVQEAQRVLEREVLDRSGVQIIVDHCTGQVDALIDEFFKDVALRFARDYQAIDSCAAIMRERGLRPILKKSSLVKGLALLGLATSVNPNRQFVAEVFDKASLSLPDTLKGLADAYEAHGYPPRVLVAEDSLFSTV